VTGAPVGFAGPVGLETRLVADASLCGVRGAISGANRADEHLVHIDQARDLPGLAFADLRRAVGAIPVRAASAARSPSTVASRSARSSVSVRSTARRWGELPRRRRAGAPDRDGCYGIGITRTVAAAIEQHHDDAGIIWPAPLAPYGVHVVPVNVGDAALRETAERLVVELEAVGVDVLLDDRDERPGVKFKDADLIGLPVRLTVDRGRWRVGRSS